MNKIIDNINKTNYFYSKTSTNEQCRNQSHHSPDHSVFSYHYDNQLCAGYRIRPIDQRTIYGASEQLVCINFYTWQDGSLGANIADL
jgi:hypothetical protein